MILINVFLIVVLTSITGSIAFGMWMVTKWIVKKVNPKIVYYSLHFVLLLYLFPVVYWLLARFMDKKIVLNNIILLTDSAGKIKPYLYICSILWLAAVCFIIIYEIYIQWKLRKLCRLGMPVTDSSVLKILNELKQKYRISKNVMLLTCHAVESPMLIGNRKPVILLPEADYTLEEIQMVLMHELMHYKNHDYQWKQVTLLIRMIHCFNPFAYHLLKHVDRWDEIYCDIRLSEKNIISMKDYYTFIINQVLNLQNESELKKVSCLFKNRNELAERMRCMTYYQKKTIWKSVLAMGLSCALCLSGVVVSYAAGNQIVTEYNKQTGKNVICIEGPYEPINSGPVIEHVMTEEQINSAIEVYDAEASVQSEQGIQWNIKPGYRYYTSSFNKKSGDTIEILAKSKNGQKTYVGIQEPNGEMRYMAASSTLSCTFSLNVTGSYRVFAENVDNENAQVWITYI